MLPAIGKRQPTREDLAHSNPFRDCDFRDPDLTEATFARLVAGT